MHLAGCTRTSGGLLQAESNEHKFVMVIALVANKSRLTAYARRGREPNERSVDKTDSCNQIASYSREYLQKGLYYSKELIDRQQNLRLNDHIGQ